MRSPDRDPVTLLSVAAYAGMFVFGIVMALLGAILPALAGRLEFQVADIGTLFLLMNGAMLAASLVLGLVMDGFGMKPPLVIGALLVAAAVVLVARATALPDLFPAVVLLGIGGGALNGGTNTLVADLHDDRNQKNAALNLLGVFFGFGALLLPFAIGALLARFSLQTLLLATAVPCALVGIFAVTLPFPPPKQAQRLPLADMARFLRDPTVVALACLLFFQSGIEFTLGGFISTYLTREMAASVALASWVLTVYWGGIMATRVVLSRIAPRTSPQRVLTVCAFGALGGALLTAVAIGPAAATIGIVVISISLAGVFPAALGIAGARFESHSGTVFGILFTVALAGGMTLPWTAGQLGERVGLRWVFGLVAFSYVAILGLTRVAAQERAAVTVQH